MDAIHGGGYASAVPSPFNPPYDWCDRRCERCPITSSCALFRREEGQRWAHEARGVDPDAPDVVASDLRSALRTALQLLEEDAEAMGVDLRTRAPAPIVMLDGPRLRAVSLELAKLAMHDDALRAPAALLAMKVARIAGHLSHSPLPADPLDIDDESAIWAIDGAPNLFLLEVLRREVAGLLGERARMDALEVLARLERMLDPLTALFAPYRPILDAMIRAGEAPSPFVLAPRAER